jgi:hypothetical protein
MKNAVFWGVIPWISCKNRRFRGTYRLRNEGDKNRRSKDKNINNWQPKQAAIC